MNVLRRRCGHFVVAVLVLAPATAGLAGCRESGGDPQYATAQSYVDAFSSQHTDSLWERQVAEQQLVAACMKERGFDFEPFDQTKDCKVGPIPDPELTASEFRKLYGYGITPLPGDRAAVNSMSCIDPNAPEGQGGYEAYMEALHGRCDNPEGCMWGPGDPLDPQTAGCQALAARELQGPYDPAVGALQELANGLSQAMYDLDTSAALRPVVGAWRECMADSGFPQIMDGHAWGDTVEEFTPQNVSIMVQDATSDLLDGPPSVDTPTADQVAAHEFEMSVVAADDACRMQSGYDEAYTAAAAEVDAQYLADHREEFAAMADFVAARDRQSGPTP